MKKIWLISLTLYSSSILADYNPELDASANAETSTLKLILPTDLPIYEYYQYIAAAKSPEPLHDLTYPSYEINAGFTQNCSTTKRIPAASTAGTMDAVVEPRQFEVLRKSCNGYASIVDLEKAAVLGSHQAQFALAGQYYLGPESERNMDLAIDYYRKAALQQDLRAEYMLGRIYLTGDGVPENYAYGFSLIKDAALKGNALAQYTVGLIYDKGIQGYANTKQAKFFYNLAAKSNYAPAQYNLAEILVHEQSDDLSEYVKASKVAEIRSLYQKAADAGIKDAIIPLAYYSADAYDIFIQTKAFDAVSHLANQDKAAAFLVGLMYAKGLGGVGVDEEAAANFYHKALGLNVADFAYGTYLYVSSHNSRSETQAMLLLEQAAETNLPYAENNLAVIRAKRGEDFAENLQKYHSSSP